MALPVAVPVGEDTADRLLKKLIPAIEALRIGVSTDKEAHYGPVVTAAHKAKVERLHSDGRRRRRRTAHRRSRLQAAGPRKGLLRRADPVRSGHDRTCRPIRRKSSARCCRSSAPPISRRLSRSPSEHQYGNGVAIFTRNGHVAREFAARVNVGMVGINVPIPVPVAYHSFGGWKRFVVRRHESIWHGGHPLLHQGEDGHPALARWRIGRIERLHHPDAVKQFPLPSGDEAFWVGQAPRLDLQDAGSILNRING